MRKLLVVLIGIAFSCNEIKECDLDPNIAFTVMVFYNSSDSTIKQVNFKSVELSNVEGRFVIDSVRTGFAFNLDPAIESITYLFETDSDTYDLTLDYSINDVSIYSIDCEPSLAFSLTEASSSQFDSVALVNPILNKDIPINVEIYF